MDDRQEAAGRPESTAQQVPPEEPFAYIRTNAGFAFKSPVSLTVFYAWFTGFGVWVLWEGVAAYRQVGAVGGLVMAVAGVVAIAAGLSFVYVGIRRWRWKREYERVMGKSPR